MMNIGNLKRRIIMGSKADRPILNDKVQNIFDSLFPVLTPKKDAREEDKQKDRQKGKKRRDND
jgi:hypothetical protein